MKQRVSELKRQLLAVANRALKPLNLQVVPAARQRAAQGRYLGAVALLEATLRQGALGHVPANPERAALLASLVGINLDSGLVMVRACHRVLGLPGAVCEFGVAQGATSALLANEIRHTDKQLWLYDSFQGLPPPTEKDRLIDDIFGYGEMQAYAGTMAVPQHHVERRLNAVGFPPERVQIVPGFVEDTLKTDRLPAQICFAFLDMDLYEPIRVTLDAIAGRVPVGGVVVVHDYKFFSAGVQAAVEGFVAAEEGCFSLREEAGMALLRRERV